MLFLILMIWLTMMLCLKLNIGKRSHLLIKIGITFLTYMLFLFKTVLIMPILNIIIISLIPEILNNLKIGTDSQIFNIIIGILILVLFAMV